MSSTPSPQPTGPLTPILGEARPGLSPTLQHRALELRARMQAGENIPLEELKSFILAGESDLRAVSSAKNSREKAREVDFF